MDSIGAAEGWLPRLVAVVGVGGVGSHCAHALVRSGVQRLRLIDFDRVTLSSLNRHAVARRSDVGIPKVSACAARFRAIAPLCEIEVCDEMFSAASAPHLLLGSHGSLCRPDVVVDCIDDLPTKADLLEVCVSHGLPVLSALGSGAKGDPTKLCISRGLQDVTNDPIAAELRTSLRKRSVDVSNVPFAYSFQKADRSLLPLSEEQRSQPSEFGNVKNFRLRVIPVLGPQPALSGVTLAAQALALLDERNLPPCGFRQIPPPSRSFAEKLMRQLHQTKVAVDLSINEAHFLIHEVWCGRSALNREHGIASAARFVLTRWDPARPAQLGNTILVTEAEATAHDGPSSAPAAVQERVQSRLSWAAHIWSPSKLQGGTQASSSTCWSSNARRPDAERAKKESQGRSCKVDEGSGISEELLTEEQLSRCAAFLGPVGHEAVRQGFVVIVGLGSVGSATASLLLRAGIGRLRLVDDATVREGAFHAVATDSDVGAGKAEVCRKAFREIFPRSEVEVLTSRVSRANVDDVMSAAPSGQAPSLVVVCTGNRETQATVMAAAAFANVRVVVAIVTIGLQDPTRITASPLAEVWSCPAAVALRLHATPSYTKDALVVFSQEHGQWHTVGDGSHRSAAESLVRFNIGLTCAAVALHVLAGEALPEPPAPGTMGAWKKLERNFRLSDTTANAESATKNKEPALDVLAVGCIVDQIWRGRSSLSGSLGNSSSLDTTTGLQLVRWDPSQPPALWNVVLLTEQEAASHRSALQNGERLAEAQEVSTHTTGSKSSSSCSGHCSTVNSETLSSQQSHVHNVLRCLRQHLEAKPKAELAHCSSALGHMKLSPAVLVQKLLWFLAGHLQDVRSSKSPSVILLRSLLTSAGLSAIVVALVSAIGPRFRRGQHSRFRLPSAEAITDSVSLTFVGAAVVAAVLQKVRRRLFRAPQEGRSEPAADDREVVTTSLKIMDSGFAGLVAQTPLVHLRSLSEATGCHIAAKAEFLSPGGCQKDRVAVRILAEAEAAGKLRPGCTVIEGTSGSTGISLALAARSRGYKVLIVMPDDQAVEKVRLLESFGATVELVRPASIVSPDHYVNVARRRADEINSAPGSPGALMADQFENLANFRAHYEGTGPELWEQCDHRLDAFVMSAGTGGTIAGVGHFLKGVAPQVGVYLADVPGSSLFSKVAHGVLYAREQQERTVRRHRTDTIAEGIGLDRLTANFAKGLREHDESGHGCIDDAVYVSDQEALDMAQYLLQHEGLFIGSSAAVNCVAACKVAFRLGPGHTIATVLCDSGLRHLSKFHNPAVWPEFDLSTPPCRDRTDLSFVQRT